MTVGPLMRPTMALGIFCSTGLLAACETEEAVAPKPNVQLIVGYDAKLLPDYVAFRLSNSSSEAACLSSTQFQLSSNALKLRGSNYVSAEHNRPPALMVGSVDVSDGLIVLPRNARLTHLVSIERVDESSPVRGILEGTILVAVCEALFSVQRPALQEISVRAKL